MFNKKVGSYYFLFLSSTVWWFGTVWCYTVWCCIVQHCNIVWEGGAVGRSWYHSIKLSRYFLYGWCCRARYSWYVSCGLAWYSWYAWYGRAKHSWYAGRVEGLPAEALQPLLLTLNLHIFIIYFRGHLYLRGKSSKQDRKSEKSLGQRWCPYALHISQFWNEICIWRYAFTGNKKR